MRVLQQQREQAALVAELAKARLIGSRATASEALAARAGVLELDNQILAAQADREAAAAMLIRWTGEESSPADEAPDFARLPVESATLLASVDRLPTVLPLQARIERAAAAVDVARAGKRPNWSLAAAYGQRSGGRDDMLMLEVGIGLPIFPGNRQDRDVAAREAEYQGALATREDQRRAAAASLRARIAQWRGLLAQVETDEQRLLPLASDRTATALTSYRGGGELNPWIEARRDELATRLSHVNHVVELGRTWAELAFLLPEGSQP
jgi:outer membrane protein TolC